MTVLQKILMGHMYAVGHQWTHMYVLHVMASFHGIIYYTAKHNKLTLFHLGTLTVTFSNFFLQQRQNIHSSFWDNPKRLFIKTKECHYKWLKPKITQHSCRLRGQLHHLGRTTRCLCVHSTICTAPHCRALRSKLDCKCTNTVWGMRVGDDSQPKPIFCPIGHR